MSFRVTIAQDLRDKAPSLILGFVSASVRVEKKDDELWQELSESAKTVASELGSMDGLVNAPQIDAARKVFRACGKKPQRYRVSSEALVRRVLQGKELYQINTVVDVNNLVSVKSLHSVGSYDLSKIQGALEMRIGRAGEAYTAIGKQQTEVAGLPIFSDDEGPCGGPWSDSIRTMISPETTRIVMIVMDFLGEDPAKMQATLDFAADGLRARASAEEIETGVVR